MSVHVPVKSSSAQFHHWPGPVSYTHLDVYKRQIQLNNGHITVEQSQDYCIYTKNIINISVYTVF